MLLLLLLFLLLFFWQLLMTLCIQSTIQKNFHALQIMFVNFIMFTNAKNGKCFHLFFAFIFNLKYKFSFEIHWTTTDWFQWIPFWFLPLLPFDIKSTSYSEKNIFREKKSTATKERVKITEKKPFSDCIFNIFLMMWHWIWWIHGSFTFIFVYFSLSVSLIFIITSHCQWEHTHIHAHFATLLIRFHSIWII